MHEPFTLWTPFGLLGRVGRIVAVCELAVTGIPTVVAYRVTPAGVQVLAVVHGARG